MMWMRALVGLIVVGGIALAPELASSRSSGAPAGFAGDVVPPSGSEPRTCTSCHSGNALNDDQGGGSVTIDSPDSAAPGETVSITVSVTNSAVQGRQGFSATVKDPDGAFVGSFTLPDASTVRLADGNQAYVTHTFTSNTQTSWTFQWTAPATNAPSEVVIYTAGNSADGNGSTSGDFVYTDTHTISLASVAAEGGPEMALGVEWTAIAPNPVRDVARATLVVDAPTHASIRLLDGRGRTVRQLETRTFPQGRADVDLDVRGLAPGLYFLVAETEAGRRTQSVNVVR